MASHSRPRRLTTAALTAVLAVLVAACAQEPNSIFHSHTDSNRDVAHLWDLLIWLGTGVFVFVESILIYTLIRFRKHEGQAEPKHVHGNTQLEILWTAIPAVILAFIAVPTVRTIFKTQAVASADALQVEVMGHQWWWEFKYPQYGIVTANELYLPIGRKVNFTLQTQDVIHSFWIPQLDGKRDLISNHKNFLWFTPDSITPSVLNGFCAEYCGSSHANMRFKTFVVAPPDFEAWAKHQEEPAAFNTMAKPDTTKKDTGPAATMVKAAAAAQLAPATESFVAFPREKIPAFAVPGTPTPPGLSWDTSLVGDPARGEKVVTGVGTCLGCHMVKGNPMMVSIIGPNLTHIASRTTIAGGLYPNDKLHLGLWVKNARLMKPGALLMPTLGLNQYDPILKSPYKMGLTDQQIADVVAYLQALK